MTFPISSLPDVASPDAVTASMWNEVTAELWRLSQMQAQSPLAIRKDAGGYYFSLDPTQVLSPGGGGSLSSLSLTPVIPTALPSNTNDYNPGAGSLFELSASAAINLTGWSAPTQDGTILIVKNIGNEPITLTHQDTNSLAANRFWLPYGQSLVLNCLNLPGSAILVYQQALPGWLCVAYIPAYRYWPTQNDNPSANHNDYDPGLGNIIALNGGAADRTFTGLIARVDGTPFIITNSGSTNNLLFTNEDSGSSAANRIHTDTGATITLGPREQAIGWYDLTLGRNRLSAIGAASPFVSSVVGTNPIQVSTTAGVATVSVLDASTTQDGTVNILGQEFAGVKQFRDGIEVGDVSVGSSTVTISLLAPTGSSNITFAETSPGNGMLTIQGGTGVAPYYAPRMQLDSSTGRIFLDANSASGNSTVILAPFDGFAYQASFTGTGIGGDSFVSGICTTGGSGGSSTKTGASLSNYYSTY